MCVCVCVCLHIYIYIYIYSAMLREAVSYSLLLFDVCNSVINNMAVSKLLRALDMVHYRDKPYDCKQIFESISYMQCDEICYCYTQLFFFTFDVYNIVTNRMSVSKLVRTFDERNILKTQYGCN